MIKLGAFKNCFLHSLELWIGEILSEEVVKRNVSHCIFVNVDELPNGDIILTIDNWNEYSYNIGNTGSGCMHEKPFSGVDFIFEKISESLNEFLKSYNKINLCRRIDALVNEMLK